MSDLVGNAEDRFSQDEAVMTIMCCFSGRQGEGQAGDCEGSPGCPDPQLQTHERGHCDGGQAANKGGQVVRQT